MSKNYNQLSLEQRYQIEALVKAGLKQKTIAEQIGVSASTICRELRRNTAKRGRTANEYVAINAQRKTNLRHSQKHKPIRFNEKMKHIVVQHLTVERWSPELISQCCGDGMVSHERIYQWIWECKHTNLRENKEYKKLYEYLRHGKRRRKRGKIKDSRGTILNRVPIEKRPVIVSKRKRLGDFEVDLMMGKNHKGALLVITDRATLHTRLARIASKESGVVLKALKSTLRRNNYPLRTFTFDNDKAFSCHELVSEHTGAKTYFTRPYTSQDKGTVENRIGVIRRFFPKKTNLTFVTDECVREVENKLNNRPIRKFNYQTANQVLRKKIALMT